MYVTRAFRCTLLLPIQVAFFVYTVKKQVVESLCLPCELSRYFPLCVPLYSSPLLDSLCTALLKGKDPHASVAACTNPDFFDDCRLVPFRYLPDATSMACLRDLNTEINRARVLWLL